LFKKEKRKIKNNLKSMSLEVKTTHRQAFREIFNLVAKDNKIDKDGLKELFHTIDYKVTED
jgi:hypothetical protein